MIDDRPVSLDELAGVLGVHKRNLQTAVDRGALTRVTRGAYPLGKSIRSYCEYLRERAASRDHLRVGSGLAAERERETRERADALALKNAAARGELIPAKAVEQEWASVLRLVRTTMLAVASRCGAQLPHLSEHDIAAIDAEIRSALTEAADDPI
jgi:phage terminase Nu1 subunit (DNA packaging protein)